MGRFVLTYRVLYQAVATLLLITDLVCGQVAPNSSSTSREKPSSQSDRPLARSEWFSKGRQVGGGVGFAGPAAPPAQKLLQSYGQLRQIRPAHLSRPGFASPPPAIWAALGPFKQSNTPWGDVSGRVTSLIVDTRNGANDLTIYVGTAFGGLWKGTSDPNDHTHMKFTPLSDQWPSLAIGSIALDTRVPSGSPPIIYVGTGEANNSSDSYYGIGILKSADGGTTWTISSGSGTPCPITEVSSNSTCPPDGPFIGGSVSKIIVDPLTPTHLLLALSIAQDSTGKKPGTAIYESNNGGDSWAPMILHGGKTTNAEYNSYNCTDLLLDTKSNTFYAAVEGLGFYSYRIGEEWRSLTSPFKGLAGVTAKTFSRASLAVRTAGNKTTIFAVIADYNGRLAVTASQETGVVRSDDGGKTWSSVKAPPSSLFFSNPFYQGTYDQYIVAPADEDSLIIGGIDVWRCPSVQNPQWKNLTNSYSDKAASEPGKHTHPDQHALIAVASKDWIVGNDGGTWRTQDGGLSWIDLNSNIASIQFMSVAPSLSSVTDYMGGSQDNGTVRGNAQTNLWVMTLGGDGGYVANSSQSPTRFYTEQDGVSLAQSDDLGQNWYTVVDQKTITQADGGAFYLPYRVLPGTVEKIVLGTRRVWLGPSIPAEANAPWRPGQGWTDVSDMLTDANNYIAAIAVAPSSPKIVYVATSDGHVYRNEDISSSSPRSKWKEIASTKLAPDRVYSALAVAPDNPDTVYLGVQGFGTGHVFKTENAGGNWTEITPRFGTGPTFENLDTPVNSILVDPLFPADVYIATDIGVFVTSDRGQNWQQFGENLPRSAVLELQMSTNRKIVAATHGRGAWLIEPLDVQP